MPLVAVNPRNPDNLAIVSVDYGYTFECQAAMDPNCELVPRPLNLPPDIFAAALGGRDVAGVELGSLDDVRARAASGGRPSLPLAPLMHGAGQWNALVSLYAGNPVVLASEARRVDPDAVVDTIHRERVETLSIVGDAFGRPLVEAIHRRSCELPTLRTIISGGSPRR